MTINPLPLPSEAGLLAAVGYPYLPVRVRYRAPQPWHPVRDGEEVARYVYTAGDGEPRFECIRFHLPVDHPAAPDKAFLWRRADGTWGLDGVHLVPYRLPRVRGAAAAGERVFVVEGEKDVHALEALGLTATCNPLGSLQWVDAYAEALRGADVVVIPDNDRPGLVHASQVMATLRGRARSAALLLLPNAGPRDDVSDWLARGGTKDELRRLADAAPRDPSPQELAALLGLPPHVDPCTRAPNEIRALLMGPGAGADTVPEHPAFRRTLAVFARLGAQVRPSAAPPPAQAGAPEAFAAWRAVAGTLQDAGESATPLLDDASRLERSIFELGMFAGLLRAAAAAEPPGATPDPDAPGTAFATAPSVRLVRTRWDWDAFMADAALPAPPESGAAYALHISSSGPLQMRRLHPLPALVLEVCARPCTAEQAAAAVSERVEGDPAQLAALVRAQMRELNASGLLRPATPVQAEATVGEMLRLLPAKEAPPSDVRGVVGMLSRSAAATREHAERAAALGDDDGLYARHLLDVSVSVLQELLERARVRAAFSAELDGYWGGAQAQARVRALLPLLDVLGRALGRGAHALPPYVLAS